jgi:dimethylargininase
MRALIRGVPASFANALSANPVPIDVELARVQHAAYRAALEASGAPVIEIPADDAHPDCCFIEDTAVVANGIALVPRLGAPSRRGEIRAVATALEAHARVLHMDEPATLDGGDCMRLGRTIYVGRSARTNAAGIARLAEVFEPHGLRVVAIDLPAHVLHLKCVCSPLGDRILLAEGSLDRALFDAEIVTVPASETYAANAVTIGAHVVIADGFPRTREAIEHAGFTPHPVPTSEVRKADGSLTCQSILLG